MKSRREHCTFSEHQTNTISEWFYNEKVIKKLLCLCKISVQLNHSLSHIRDINLVFVSSKSLEHYHYLSRLVEKMCC